VEAVVKGRGRDREPFCSLTLSACGIRVEKVNCELNHLLLSQLERWERGLRHLCEFRRGLDRYREEK
jgi:hypothetical protein